MGNGVPCTFPRYGQSPYRFHSLLLHKDDCPLFREEKQVDWVETLIGNLKAAMPSVRVLRITQCPEIILYPRVWQLLFGLKAAVELFQLELDEPFSPLLLLGNLRSIQHSASNIALAAPIEWKQEHIKVGACRLPRLSPAPWPIGRRPEKAGTESPYGPLPLAG